MKKYLNDMIQSLQWLIRIDSVEEPAQEGKPFGEGCFMALQYTLALAQSMGFATKNVDNYAGHAEIGEGEIFGILGHLDTVPHGKGWSYPPVGGVIDNGRIYGRGALDNKGPVIAAMYAVKALLDEGYKPKMKIRFIYGCDEESGWKCMDYYFSKEEKPVMGIAPDADFPVINCEKGVSYYSIALPLPDGIIDINGGERANMVPDYAMAIVANEPKNTSDAKVTKTDNGYVIECVGKSVHASCPDKGDNALWKLFKILSDNYDGVFKIIYDKLTSNDGSKCAIKLSDDISGALTMNLGTAKAVNGMINLMIDTRQPVSIKKEDVLEILRGEFEGFAVEQGDFHDPLYVAPDHELVKTLLEAYNDVMGTDAKPITIGGGTYARALPLGVAFGPIFPGQESSIHSKDENIAIDDLLKMSEIYYEAFKRLLFTKI